MQIIAREFLWLIFILFVAVPISFLFMATLDLVSEGRAFVLQEKYIIIELYLIIYFINFIGLYLCRLVVLAIKMLAPQ